VRSWAKSVTQRPLSKACKGAGVFGICALRYAPYLQVMVVWAWKKRVRRQFRYAYWAVGVERALGCGQVRGFAGWSCWRYG
jgi:hypothetical protein